MLKENKNSDMNDLLQLNNMKSTTFFINVPGF